MAQFNQILYFIFALFLLGILTSTVGTRFRDEHKSGNAYWSLSILARSFSLLAWAVVPWTGTWILMFAILAYMGAALTLCLLFRSWNQTVEPVLPRLSVWVLLAAAVGFEIIRQTVPSFSARITLVGSFMVVCNLWQTHEILKLMRTDRSINLKLMLFLTVLTLTGFIVRIVWGFMETDLNSPHLLVQPLNHIALTLVSFGSNILLYVLIASYGYQKLWNADSLALQELQHKSGQLQLALEQKDAEIQSRQEMERLLSEKNKLLRSLAIAQKTSTMGTMVSSLAHELNQPLGAMRLQQDFLAKQLQANGDLAKYATVVNQLSKDSQRAVSIIDRLRRFFQAGSGEFVDVNLSQLLRDVLSISQPEAQARQIEMLETIADDIHIFGDQGQLQMVVMNLINNAMEAMQEQDRRKFIRIDLSVQGDLAWCQIHDNGPGIALDQLDRLFQLFETTKKSGMGVGLWLSRAIMDVHGGRIGMANPGVQGAKFTLAIPLNPART